MTAGVASIVRIGVTSVGFVATEASGGTAPYTKQWQISTDGGSTYSSVSGATALESAASGLTAETAYKFRLHYTDSASATANSNVLTATTGHKRPIRWFSGLAPRLAQRRARL